MHPIIIVGSGLAGYTLAREYRKLAPDAPLCLITADSGHAYSKPMLSTAFAKRKAPEQLIMSPAARAPQELNARIVTETPVSKLSPERRQLILETGEELVYRELVLALGADTLKPRLKGDAAGDVRYVNDLDDYANLRTALVGAKHVVILGAGLVGCEFANDLCLGGYRVSVVAPEMAPLSRLLPENAGCAVRNSLGEAGIEWHLGRLAVSVAHSGGHLAVELDDGATLHADVIISAVGLTPRTELARQAGLAVNKGIVVDRFLRSSDGNIYALGDCAEVEGHSLMFVNPLTAGARALAQTLAGRPTPVSYPAMPVVVKTSACPVVSAPPAPGLGGEWFYEGEGKDLCARFLDGSGSLQGFALTGERVHQRLELTRQLPPLMA